MTIARPYQERALDQARAAIRNGARRILMVAPTGAGKSVLMVIVSKGRVARKRRVGVFVHTRELVGQMVRHLRGAGLEVGANGENRSASIQVVTVQACLASGELPDVDDVLIDEAHHYVASDWRRVLAVYRERKALIIGVTATPERADGIGLGEEFEVLIVVAQRSELTAAGWLVPCDVIDGVTSPTALAQAPFKAYLDHAAGKPAVVFAPNVDSAESFAKEFRDAGVEAEALHGKMPKERRDAVLAAFTSGRLPVVCNVRVLTEGFDYPGLKVGILATKMQSLSQYDQVVGRILRPEFGIARPGERALLIDLVDNVERHGPPDEDREYSLDGIAVQRKMLVHDGIRMCRTCRCEIPPGQPRCPDCNRDTSIVIPTPEEIELIRREGREREKARLEKAREELPCRRSRALATMYEKGLRKNHKRTAAEGGFRRMYGYPPPADLAALAWKVAVNRVAPTKGDAWEPPKAAAE